MNMYLVAAFVLLLVMLFLILRPFLVTTAEPVAEGSLDLTDPGARARSVATVERVARAPRAEVTPTAAAAGTATTVTATPDAVEDLAVPADERRAAATPDDVRASVEAVIAARKAALQARHCTACEAVVETGDAFCRACGTKVTA